MTLQARAASYAAIFPKFHASHLRVVRERGGDVLYGIWLMGNDYRNKTKYYGAYPPSYLERVAALFPDVTQPTAILHAFSGSLPGWNYIRLDVNPALNPDVVGSVYNVGTLFDGHSFQLVYADPPYSKSDATRYSTTMIDRRQVLRALGSVTAPGGFLVWLDTCWPMFSKGQWRTVGRIAIVRSTNHRVRLVSIFERQAAA